MASSVKIEGLGKLDAALKVRAAALAAITAAAVAAEVEAVESDATEAAPRDTGELQGSIHGTAQGASGEVEASSRHAGFNEFGTSKMPARPFMGPASDRSRTRFVGRVSAATRKAMG